MLKFICHYPDADVHFCLYKLYKHINIHVSYVHTAMHFAFNIKNIAGQGHSLSAWSLQKFVESCWLKPACHTVPSLPVANISKGRAWPYTGSPSTTVVKCHRHPVKVCLHQHFFLCSPEVPVGVQDTVIYHSSKIQLFLIFFTIPKISPSIPFPIFVGQMAEECAQAGDKGICL